jgi:hypothetical protein
MKFAVEFRTGNGPSDLVGEETINSNYYAIDMACQKVGARKYPKATEAWVWDAHDYRDDNPFTVALCPSVLDFVKQS